MNPVCSEDFSPHHRQATTEVVTMNKNACEGFSPPILKATTEIVTTNDEVGGAFYV